MAGDTVDHRLPIELALMHAAVLEKPDRTKDDRQLRHDSSTADKIRHS